MKKVILVPSYDLASQIPFEAFNTVEAEYGDNCIEGKGGYTLAHHGIRSHNPAPCVTLITPHENDLPIVVSHVDLDTLGGIMALWGEKPNDFVFWSVAAYVDINGPHKLNLVIGEKVKMQLRAFWAWNEANRKPRYTEVTDVTESVIEACEVIRQILAGNEELIQAGKKWADEILAATESRLISENGLFRVFITDSVFCSANYWSPNTKRLAEATVVLNTKFNSITLAFEDGGKEFSAREIVQELWGKDAGGHNGIAGSPRGQIMTHGDLLNLCELLEEVMN